MIRVLIIDKHAIVREGLKRILQEPSDIVVIDEASGGQEALEKVWENEYNVVLLDISMPSMNSLDILKQIKRAKPDLSILTMSMYPEEHYAVRVFKAGASGYLTKSSTPDELLDAVRKVAMGGRHIDPSIAEALANYVERDVQKPLHETLSDRELQVMLMIASGKTVTEIAKELFLSITTVSTYRSKVLAKMNMRNNAEITYYAIKHGLVE